MLPLRCIFVYGTYLAIMYGVAVVNSWFFGLVHAVMWGLCVDHSSSAVGHMCDVAGIFI